MYKNILVSVDLGDKETAEKTIKAAVGLAKSFSARLHVMSVVPDYGMSLVATYFPPDFEKKALEHANSELHAFTTRHVPGEVEHRHIVAHGSIYREILENSETTEADLVVIGASRPRPEDFFIGPNASRVVGHASTSVLVVR